MLSFAVSSAAALDPEHLVGDEQAVVAIGDEVNRNRRDHDPQRTNVLTAAQSDD